VTLLLLAAALGIAPLDCSEAPALKGSGYCGAAEDGGREKLPTPGVQWRINEASATRAPWVDANGWRFERKPGGRYLYVLPAGKAALAAGEAFAYHVDARLRIDPNDLDAYRHMAAFLKQIDAAPLPARANLGVLDDGTPLAGEVLNLLARRNLLFRVVREADPGLDLTVRITPEAADPSAFAAKVRRQLGDDKRLLRIYGSEVVVGRLTGDRSRARLHLLNYGGSKIEGLRVRVLGSYSKVEGAPVAAAEVGLAGGAAEFTLPEVGSYAVVDLTK